MALAQNFSMQVANPNPLGLGGLMPVDEVFDLDLGGAIKGDIDYGIGMETTYNSNLNLSETDENDDVSLVVNPWLRYDTDPEGGARFSIVANYRPSMIGFLENSEYNRFNQNGDIVFRFEGAKTLVELFARYQQLSGSDYLTGDFIEGSLFTTGVRVSRQVAPRTNVFGGVSAAMSDYQSSLDQGAEVYSGYLGALWSKSERLRLGGSLRYSMTQSDNSGDRNAIALLLEARYLLGDRTRVSVSLGPEFADTDGAGSAVNLSADAEAVYMINERWSWRMLLRSATVPSPNEANTMVSDLSVQTSLQRRMLRGMLGGGLEYRYATYDDGGLAAVERDNEATTGVFIEYRRPLGSERLAFESRARYSFNDGVSDWEQFQLSLGLQVSF